MHFMSETFITTPFDFVNWSYVERTYDVANVYVYYYDYLSECMISLLCWYVD